MIVRPETPADFAVIRAVEEVAFPTAAEADLVERLRADGDSVCSLVADDDGAIVGHVLFSRMTAPFRALGLAPVAVLPRAQRNGIAALFIRDGLARAKAQGWVGVFVLGEPAYYQRFGFDIAMAAGFSSPYAGEHFMALALQGDDLPVRHGTVSYPRAFADLD
jgi:putative acetyltransferase